MSCIRSLCLLGLSLLAVSWIGVGVASAADCEATLADGSTQQGKTLEGEVRKVSKKELILAKSGEMVELVPHEQTVVSGKKNKYKKLKKNDYVHVCFKRSMTRKEPRYAWTIEVTEKPDDGAVEVE